MINKCSECSSPLEATVPCYLENVKLGEDGQIEEFVPAFNGSYRSSLCLEPWEHDAVSVYCENDHYFDYNMDSGNWELRCES